MVDYSGAILQDVRVDGKPLEEGCSLCFQAITGINPPYTVKWQIVNTGYDARNARCFRG